MPKTLKIVQVSLRESGQTPKQSQPAVQPEDLESKPSARESQIKLSGPITQKTIRSKE